MEEILLFTFELLKIPISPKDLVLTEYNFVFLCMVASKEALIPVSDAACG